MPIRHYGDEIAFNIRKPRLDTPKAVGAAEQEAFNVLNALHTQCVDALPEDNPLLGLLSRTLDEALLALPELRVP